MKNHQEINTNNIEIEKLEFLSSSQKFSIKKTIKSLFKNKSVKRVLLINPPDGDISMFKFETAKAKRYTNFAPYGLGIASKYLKQSKLECKILNLNHLILLETSKIKEKSEFNYDEIIKKHLKKIISEFKPDFVGLTCMFSMTHKSLKNISRIIKSLTDVPIAAGGVHISNAIWDNNTRKDILKDLNEIDIFFLFEAELALCDFIKFLNTGFENLKLLKQFFLRKNNNIVFFKERLRPEGDELNIIPDHRQMFSSTLSTYGKVGNFNFLINKDHNITTVLSNRGCRAQCTFCSVRNFNGMKVRQRSVQSVIDELLYLRDKQNISHIMWLDDDLLYNEGRTLELFNQMIKQDVDITWDASNGVIAYSIKDEVMDAAEKSGCLGLVIGMESGNPEILRQVKKPGQVKTFIEAARVLRKYPKINSRVFLMIGFPNETYNQILDTINVSKEMSLDWNYITPLQPLPNTPIFDEMVDDELSGTEGFSETKYFSGGGYSGVNSKKKDHALQQNFESIFSDKDLDTIPSAADIKTIWAFMNYYLNFEPLKKIRNFEKLKQNQKWMDYISNVVAKEDPIALFYKILIDKQLNKSIDSTDISKMNKIFSTDTAWVSKMNELGLRVHNMSY